MEPSTGGGSSGGVRTGRRTGTARVLAVVSVLVATAFANRVLPVGIHFDVEPQAMPEWTSPLYTQAQIIGYLLDLVDELDARWTLNQRPVMWTWDIPNWYILYSMERNGQNKTYAAWMIDSGLDRVSVMNFVDAYGTQVSRMADVLAYATLRNKPVGAAVETQDLSYSPVTFFEEGAQYMQNVLVQADQALAAMAPHIWNGYTIHDYAALRTLPSSSNYSYVSARIPVCIYVWQWWLAFDNYTTDRNDMWTFLAAQPYTITRILFESESLLDSDQMSLQAFITEAAAHGYEVELAVGFSYWTLPQYHVYVETLMQIAANFILLGPAADPFNPGSGPAFPTNSPAPTVIKTDVPWPTDVGGGTPTSAAWPTTASPSGSDGSSTGAPGPSAKATDPPNRVPDFQLSAAARTGGTTTQQLVVGAVLTLFAVLAAAACAA